MMYRDRQAAGQRLAEMLEPYANREDVIVLALPRGGVTVAREVAQALNAPLDVLVVRKLGFPWQPELAAGAIGPRGVMVLNPTLQDRFPDFRTMIEPVLRRERGELKRREALYRREREPPDLQGRSVILVDDGIATGATMEAAIQAVRALGAASVVLAVPVAPPDTIARLAKNVDRVFCPLQPSDFSAVGQYYESFPQLNDAAVISLLHTYTRHE